MPRLKTYDLFICHAWRYDDDYTRLVKFLRAAVLCTIRWTPATPGVSVARLIARFDRRASSS